MGMWVRKKELQAKSARRWFAGMIALATLVGTEDSRAEDGIRELRNPNEMASVAPVRAIGIRLTPATPIHPIDANPSNDLASQTQSLGAARASLRESTEPVTASFQSGPKGPVALPVSVKTDRKPERIAAKSWSVTSGSTSASPVVATETIALADAQSREPIRVVPQAPIRLSFANEEIHKTESATPPASIASPSADSSHVASLPPGLPMLPKAQPSELAVREPSKLPVPFAMATSQRGPATIAPALNMDVPPLPEHSVARAPEATRLPETHTAHLADTRTPVDTHAAMELPRPQLPIALPAPIPASATEPVASSQSTLPMQLPAVPQPMQMASVPKLIEPVRAPVIEEVLAAADTDTAAPNTAATKTLATNKIEATNTAPTESVVPTPTKLDTEPDAVPMPPSSMDSSVTSKITAPALQLDPPKPPAIKNYTEQELSRALSVELESQSAREIQVDVAIEGIAVTNERVCRALASDGRVFLVGGELGESIVEVKSTTGTESKLLRVKVVAPWQRSSHGVADLDQLLLAIRPLAPEGNLTIRAQEDGSIIVKGKVPNKEAAKRVMELTRKLILVPVVDKLEIR